MASGAGLTTLFEPRPARAQLSEPVACADAGQPLLRIPELRSQGGKLNATIVLSNEWQRLNLNSGDPPCLLQDVRLFRGLRAVLPEYPGVIPSGYPNYGPLGPGGYRDPVPGPTLRARVGDIVQLTLLNHISTGGFWKTLDRGERNEGCDDNASAPYPGPDEFPDCFHGSTTGNIHFHGTHTTPGTTGDNIFLEVRPSIRTKNGTPVVTEASVRGPFAKFFSNCESELNKNLVSQWPRNWSDLPREWTRTQESLLKQYDRAIINKLWPVNERQIQAGAWPQYYIGAFPFCFRLPEYTEQTWPPSESAHPAAHTAVGREERRALRMGQTPGIHWYHAHKHGSTTIDVSNGMTGAFIIEGRYDDELNRFYGADWSRRQPVLVINQLGTVPNLFAGGGPGPMPLSVNGRLQPRLTMRPGEVQLWRIANTASRSGVFFAGFSANSTLDPNSAGFSWKQLAQDGVQFASNNYNASRNNNPRILLAPGNRADLLVKAPDNQTGQPQVFNLLVRDAVSSGQTQSGTMISLLTVQVESSPAVTGRQSEFISGPDYPTFPPFLADIAPGEVKTTKTVTFETAPAKDWPPSATPSFAMHTIDGKRFDGNVGQVVLLNTVEEWKVENRTVGPVIDHPFHIHVNPFQVVEVFDPRERLPGTSTSKYIFEGEAHPGQCKLDIDRPDSWKPCDDAPRADLVWWDVFPIPAGRSVTVGTGPAAKTEVVPGYFKMRSRFVDFAGQYVIHCHILAHEDRGMMTIVQVVPFTTPYSHQ
jgi:FtsP/CotA-like multicopper oxidase with cupredoxin domain